MSERITPDQIWLVNEGNTTEIYGLNGGMSYIGYIDHFTGRVILDRQFSAICLTTDELADEHMIRRIIAAALVKPNKENRDLI
jgi:hypothetical protein